MTSKRHLVNMKTKNRISITDIYLFVISENVTSAKLNERRKDYLSDENRGASRYSVPAHKTEPVNQCLEEKWSEQVIGYDNLIECILQCIKLLAAINFFLVEILEYIYILLRTIKEYI